MTIHKAAEAFPNGSSSADLIRLKLGAAFPLVILTAAEITSLDFSLINSVAIPEVVIVRDTGVIYCRDETSVGPHNGVTILGAASGQFYVAPLAPQAFTNVLEIRNTPPTSPAPAAGDRYIVGTAPTGAWASEAETLTFYDGLQWVHVNPVIGQGVYVRNVAGKYHWGESGEWIAGDGAFTVAEEGVDARELAFPWGMVVESETATPPPSSPAITEGVKYIVAASATGAWSGHDTEIAVADGVGGWVFYSPYDGALVLNRATKAQVRFNSATGLWVSAGGVWIGSTGPHITTGNGSTTTAGSGTYAYSDSVPPAGQQKRIDSVSITHQAKRAGATLRLTYSARILDGTTVAVYRDGETTAIAHLAIDATFQDHRQLAFFFTAIDALSHEYKVCLLRNSSAPSEPINRVIFLEEGA